jgi:hypothetical protein
VEPQSRGADVLILRVRVEDSAVAAVPLAEEHDASSGSPLQLKVMALAKPEPAAIFTGTSAVSPATTVIWSTPIMKMFGGVESLTTCVMAVEMLGVELVSPA